jgi:uncharacterized protein DUF4124
MKSVAVALLLAVALPAQAQLYKCVDARGKIQYSDKPIPGCRSEKTIETPAPRAAPAPAATAGAKASGKQAAKATNPEAVPREQLAARCKTLREEQEWLNGADGKAVPFHSERVTQVEQALRECR